MTAKSMMTFDLTTMEPNQTLQYGNNSDYNDDYSFFNKMKHFVFVMYIIIFLVGVIGNGLVIYVILRFARMQTVTNCYIFNLALADELFVLTMVLSGVSLLQDSWSFGVVICYIMQYMDLTNQFTSVYTLTAMSVDRYIAVCHPAQAGKYRRFPIVVGVCIGIWIMSASMAIPMFIHVKHDNNLCYLDFSRFGDEEKWSKTLFLYTLNIGLCIPLLIIIVSYVLLLLRLKQVTARTGKSKKNRKVTKMVMIIVFVFFICWSPFYLLRLLLVFYPKAIFDFGDMSVVRRVRILMEATTVISYSNSCANPILYAFLSENFRKSYQQARPCLTPIHDEFSVGGSYFRKKYQFVTNCPRSRSHRDDIDDHEDSSRRGDNYRLAPMTMTTSTTCGSSPYTRIAKEENERKKSIWSGIPST